MERSNAFKLSTEELKKINYLMPKGYKFVLREEIVKKDVPKSKKKVIPPVPIAQQPPNPVFSKMRSEKMKED